MTTYGLCCEEFDGLDYYLNAQPHGIYLELPTGFTIDWTHEEGYEPDLRFKRIGELKFCPFCGTPIKVYSQGAFEEDIKCEHSDSEYESLSKDREICSKCGKIRVKR